MPGTLFRGEDRIHLLFHGLAHSLLHGLARGLLDFQDGPDLGLLFWIQSQHDRHALEVGIDTPARTAPSGISAASPHGGTRLHHAATRRSLPRTKTATGLGRDCACYRHQANGTGNEGLLHIHFVISAGYKDGPSRRGAVP